MMQWVWKTLVMCTNGRVRFFTRLSSPNAAKNLVSDNRSITLWCYCQIWWNRCVDITSGGLSHLGSSISSREGQHLVQGINWDLGLNCPESTTCAALILQLLHMVWLENGPFCQEHSLTKTWLTINSWKTSSGQNFSLFWQDIHQQMIPRENFLSCLQG